SGGARAFSQNYLEPTCDAKQCVCDVFIFRRSYVGVELVQWLLEQCVFVQCRMMAARVWQVLLELGILHSVDQRVVFEDSNTYYQFSFEECDAQGCEFRSEAEWQNGVRLLLQLVPYVQAGGLPGSVSEGVMGSMAWDCGLKYLFSLPPALQQGSVCALRSPEELSRLEMVQRLAKDGCRFLQNQNYRSSSYSVCSTEGDYQSDSSSSAVSNRYVVVSGTPHKILEHLLSDLRLDEHQGATEEMLLDDFLLTYLVFMSTNDLCQALLGQYPSLRCRGKEEGKEALYRKRKVLHLVSQWSSLYKDFLREEENVKLFMKTLYRYVLEDVYEFPTLEKDLKEFQKLLQAEWAFILTVLSSVSLQNKALFQQLSLKENGIQLRGAHSDSREVMCRVYVSSDSYLSIRVRTTVLAQELLHIVAQRMEKPEEDMVLVAQTYSGEKRAIQPHDCIFSESLTPPGRLMACWKDLSEILPPLTDCQELAQRPTRLLGINTWDVSVALTNLDWSLFNSVHEQELIYYTFSRQASSGHTVALEQLLQRCNEVQQWVMSEVLLCPSLGKRVQLLKKFIKIAAHCKAQRNLNSSFAIIMGLNTAAVSRLNQTWEKVPGKFKKLFSELELLTDPSLNHKAYRDAFRKMKPPKIPFMPLLLKDITFIHEGNKTFHDNLVNFEKLHMIADTVRHIRHCQTDQAGGDGPDVRASVHYLHIIDNQQTLFELSHRLEPRA
uniref:Rap guanine nucleotide exchange factor (GEF) 5a n=1 Tax=Pygocentrus nattereri TaxID=42514 RepID=A0AAR2L3J8_PYGNA